VATTRSLDGALLDLALSVRQRPVRGGDDTDARILVESIQLFARRGYAGTSMREIAAAVGIQPASIYSHFGSKQQLLADALDDVLYQFHSFILDATIPGGQPREQLRRVVGQHVRWQLGSPHVAGSWDVLWEIEAVAGNVDEQRRDALTARRELYHVLLSALVAALRPGDPNPRLRADAIACLCDRAGSWGPALETVPDEDAVVGAAWELVEALVA
jgi:AcrR family transcriptional regulator